MITVYFPLQKVTCFHIKTIPSVKTTGTYLFQRP